MNAVLFQSHLLAIVIKKIVVIVIAFENLEHKKIHQTNQLNCAGNTLFYFTIETDSCEIIRAV